MRRFQVLKPITLAAGRLELTEAQTDGRAGQIRQLEEGVYEITAPTQFCPGEKIGYDGEVGLLLSLDLQPLDEQLAADVGSSSKTAKRAAKTEEARS